MTNSEKDIKELYDGKYFYVIQKNPIDGSAIMDGPYSNIMYLDPVGTGFVQVIEGQPVAFFEPDQVAVLDQKFGTMKSENISLAGCNIVPSAYCGDCSCGKRERVEGKK